jgi:hypothetical protein
MNEKIKELARQAEEYTYGDNGRTYGDIIQNGTSWEEIYDQKFAELIIMECVLEAMDAIHHNNSIRIQLYKHFGIE